MIGQSLPYNRIHSNTNGREETEISSEQTVWATCCIQVLLMDAKFGEWKIGEKQKDAVSEIEFLRHLPPNQAGGIATLWQSNPAESTFLQVIKWPHHQQEDAQIDSIDLMIWCTKEDTTSLLWHSCPKCISFSPIMWTREKHKLRDRPQTHRPVLFKGVKVVEDKETLKNYYTL